MTVCDICLAQDNISEIEFKEEHFEICEDCIEDLENYIGQELTPQQRVDNSLAGNEDLFSCWLAGGCQ